LKIALIITAVFFLIFAILLFVPFYLVIEFSKKENEKKINASIKYLFFKVRLKRKAEKKNKPEKKDKKEIAPKKEEKLIERVNRGIETYKSIEDDLVDILCYASKKAITIKKMEFCLDFGLENPMHTGITTGALYGVVYNVLSVLNNLFEVEECDIKINPDFDRKRIDVLSECIFSIKNVHIIIIVFKVLKMYFKIKKAKTGN